MYQYNAVCVHTPLKKYNKIKSVNNTAQELLPAI